MKPKNDTRVGRSNQSAQMRPRARLINLIGEDLISDEPVAIVELVKNSYDADARLVSISFAAEPFQRPAWITIEDDGHGMDLETVLGAWLEPGTIVKKQSERSPKGRLYQGAKGIGRFAAARLGAETLLESKAESGQGIAVLLDWNLFEEVRYLDEITIPYEVGADVGFSRGTRITVSSLRRDWGEKDYEELHSRLSRLISPFDEVRDFRIQLQIPLHDDLSGEVAPPDLILLPRYQLKGRVQEDGQFIGVISLAEGQSEPIKVQLERESPVCGPFDVEIRAWDRDRSSLQPIIERTGQSLRQIRNTLSVYSGVSIYRDGFRVYPYGQKGNDWLNLDIRSRQNPGKNLANNQIVAAVKISRHENPHLRDRSTREGLVLNSGYDALVDWFKKVLSILEEGRYREKRAEPEDFDEIEPLFEAFDLGELVEHAKAELGSQHPVARMAVDSQRQIKSGIERVQEVFSRLLLSAGLGHMIDVVIHEIGSPLGKINRQITILIRDLKNLLDVAEWDRIEPKFESIKGWLEQIHGMRQRLEPHTPAKRGRATQFDVIEEVRDNIDLYEALIKKQNIQYTISSSVESLRVKMSRAALGQVLANLIDNSIYWLIRRHGSGNGGQLSISIEPADHGFSIRVSDDGEGVSEEDQAIIFEPYFTRKVDGMGLGLYIARLLIEPYGKLLYRDDCDLGGACFEAIFEKGVGL